MCPDLNKNICKQSGSMLIVAIFIIVVMGILVLGLSRLLQASTETVVTEVLGTRAFYAAQSGLELGLQQLFALDAATASCSNVEQEFPFYNIQGLINCKANVSCVQSASSENPDITHYLLKSTGSCENDLTLRTVEIEVWQ